MQLELNLGLIGANESLVLAVAMVLPPVLGRRGKRLCLEEAHWSVGDRTLSCFEAHMLEPTVLCLLLALFGKAEEPLGSPAFLEEVGPWKQVFVAQLHFLVTVSWL